MSRHTATNDGATVPTVLLGVLDEEDANLASAEKHWLQCIDHVRRHEKRSVALRAALRALGVEPNAETNYE